MEGASGGLRHGEYRLEPGITPDGLLDKLVRGEVVTYLVRVPEGITTRTLIESLNSNPHLIPLASHIDLGNLVEALGLSFPFAEGIFLPDTYQVKGGDTVASVLKRANEAMLDALAVAWAERVNVEVASEHELLILASIIEKETGDPNDRGQISQVFHRRLSIDMRLQTDPTVIYALGDTFDGDIRRRDLRVDSPFNTYRVKGLPPTPIALPSKAAIQAAAKPAEGDYLYFVARGDGTSQFSRTLDAHNQAVRRYQLRAQ